MTDKHGSAVLDIADLSTLQYGTPQMFIDQFKEKWGISPTAVSIPILSRTGIPFKTTIASKVAIPWYETHERVYLGNVIQEFARLGLDIYLNLDPSLGFVNADALQIVDIAGDTSRRACIEKAATRRILTIILTEAIAIAKEACERANTGRFVAIAINLTDILPMRASKERIELTCFCKECIAQLSDNSNMKQKLISNFQTFPNPWNLALKDSGTGINYISDLTWNMTAEQIVGKSKLKGFDSFFTEEDKLEQLALTLIDYLHARHKQIVSITTELFEHTRKIANSDLDRVIIMEGTAYVWTAGVFLEELDDPSICDEIWFDPTGAGLTTNRVRSRSYMWRRCRYTQDNFFSMVANAQDEGMRAATGIARLPEAMVRKEVDRRRATTISAQLKDKLDLFALPAISTDGKVGRVGFVGSNLTDSISRRIVSGMKIAEGFNTQEQAGSDREAALHAFLEMMGGMQKG